MVFQAIDSTKDGRITKHAIYYGTLIQTLPGLRIFVYDNKNQWMSFAPHLFIPHIPRLAKKPSRNEEIKTSQDQQSEFTKDMDQKEILLGHIKNLINDALFNGEEGLVTMKKMDHNDDPLSRTVIVHVKNVTLDYAQEMERQVSGKKDSGKIAGGGGIWDPNS